MKNTNEVAIDCTAKYGTQGEWVTMQTSEIGCVRYLQAPSAEIAETIAAKLNSHADLLAALEELVTGHSMKGEEMARAAIAKAKVEK